MSTLYFIFNGLVAAAALAYMPALLGIVTDTVAVIIQDPACVNRSSLLAKRLTVAAVLAACGLGCAMSGHVIIFSHVQGTKSLYIALTIIYALLASATAGAVARAHVLAVWQKGQLRQGLGHALRIPYVETKAEKEPEKEPEKEVPKRQMGSLLRKVSSCCLAAAALLQNARKGLQENLSDAAKEARREQDETWTRVSACYDTICHLSDAESTFKSVSEAAAGERQTLEDTPDSDTSTLVELDILDVGEREDLDLSSRGDTWGHPIVAGAWKHKADYWEVQKRAAIRRATINSPTTSSPTTTYDTDVDEMIHFNSADVTGRAVAALRANMGFASTPSHLSDVIEEEEDERMPPDPRISQKDLIMPLRTLSRRGKNSNLRNLAYAGSFRRGQGQAGFKARPCFN